MAKRLVLHSTLPAIREGLTKRQIESMASVSVDALLEEGNVFEVAEAIAAMEEFVKAVRKDSRYIDFIRDELAKNNGKLRSSSGACIELCEAGVSYDYSQDGTWRMMDEQMKILQEQKKCREEELRKLAPGRLAVDPETGEVLQGPTKTSRSTYKITLAK
jgi:hypothetical protein